MKPLLWMFQVAFGCHHSHLSQVFTIKKRTYKVCVECGQEFEYSWARMHTLRSKVADNFYTARNSAGRAEISIM